MSPRTSRQSIDTAVGRVDATALEELRENFGTHELLDLVDALDEWRARIGDPNGLRADLLRLHAVAQTLSGAKRAMQLLRPLTKLAPDE